MLTPSRTAGRTCYDVGVTQRVSPIGWPKPAHLAKPSADDWSGSQLLTATSEYKEKFGSTPSFDQTAGGFRGAGESRTGSANPRFGFVPPQTFSSTRLPAWVDNEPISVTRPVSRAAREARATTASSPYRDGSAGGVGSPGGRGGFAADAAHASVAGYGSPGLFSSGAFGAASVSAPRPGTAVPGPRGGAALSSTHASTLSPASPHRSLAFPGSAAFAVSGVLVSNPESTLPRHPRLIRPVTADATRRAYVSETAAQYVARSSVLPWPGSK